MKYFSIHTFSFFFNPIYVQFSAFEEDFVCFCDFGGPAFQTALSSFYALDTTDILNR